MFMLAGTPTMQIPLYMEQLMFARRIKAMGAGEIATLDQPQRIAAGINAIMSSPGYGESARRFADQYRDYDQNCAIRQAAADLEVALGLSA
jgi:UDP:flavonoid glycosyltransferase YjiC (YdhE family)